MTPKEKAIELVEMFDETLTYLESKNKAKQCALICIDEMLAIDLRFFGSKFLKEVKQEINKL